MSFDAAHESKDVRRSCDNCRDRPPSPDRPGRGTVLCFECYRSELNRQRSERLEATPLALPLPPFFSNPRQLTNAEIAHRLQMLEFLERCRANGRGAVV